MKICLHTPLQYIYIFKTFPTLHFDFFLIIMNALSFMWVAIKETTCWTALLLWLQFVWKEKKERAVYIF